MRAPIPISKKLSLKDAPATRGALYWLAVATSDNCSVLAQMHYPFYALNSEPEVLRGDKCILYRSAAPKGLRGFIGAFEFQSGAIKDPVRLGDYRTFSIKIPWKSIVISDDAPVDIVPLVKHLGFITNKTNYSMSLRNSFRTLPEADYRLILGNLTSNSAKPVGKI